LHYNSYTHGLLKLLPKVLYSGSIKAYCIRRFPKVWSSLLTVKIAALETLVSFAIVILHQIESKDR